MNEATSTLTCAGNIQRRYNYSPTGQMQAIEDSRRGSLSDQYDPAVRLIESHSALGSEVCLRPRRRYA